MSEINKKTSKINLGFIGYGEASKEISSGLKEYREINMSAFDPMQFSSMTGEKIKRDADNNKVKLCENIDELLHCCEIIIAAVPADKSYLVSEEVKLSSQHLDLYIDVSASDPSTKANIQKNINQNNTMFVDVAMMGPLTVHKHKVPILASGDGVDLFREIFSKYKFNIEKVSQQAGDASAVKLIRSIYMKGVCALLFEMLEAASKYGVEDRVIHSLEETLDGSDFLDTMNRLVVGTSIHADRRSKELLGTIEILKEKNIDYSMSQSSYEKLNKLAEKNLKAEFNGKKPTSWKEVIKKI